MKFYSSILIVLAIFLAQECNHKKNGDKDENHSETPIDLGEKRAIIKMSKNPCFGKCPIYNMTIFTDGQVEFKGQRFTNKLGTYSKQISTEVVKSLVKELNEMDFLNMQNNYPSKLPDLPKTNITYHPDSNTTKTVTGDNQRPEALLAFDKKLVDIAMSDGWTLIEPNENTKPLADYIIKNEIIAKFNPDIDIPDYIRSQSEYGLDIKKRIAPNLDMWLLTYDTTKISPNDMLLRLKDSREVEEAEFNKQLTPREH